MRVFTFLPANALCLLTRENQGQSTKCFTHLQSPIKAALGVGIVSRKKLKEEKKSHGATFYDCLSLGAQGGREAAQLEAVVECVLEQMGLLRESSLGTALVTLACLHTVVNSWPVLCIIVQALSAWSHEIVKLCWHTMAYVCPHLNIMECLTGSHFEIPNVTLPQTDQVSELDSESLLHNSTVSSKPPIHV